MECRISTNLAFSAYRLGKKKHENALRGVQNACSSYDPLKNPLQNDKKMFFMGYYGIPCKAAKRVNCLPIKFIYRLHSWSHDSDR